MKQENSGVCADQGAALTSYLDALLALEYRAPAPGAPVPQATAVAAHPLTCFVFSIAGLKLAVLLDRVAAILDYTECMGQPQPPSQLGVVMHAGATLPVLDIARIVMPQTSISEPYRHLVVVDGRCAWACHKVDTVIEVMSDAVRWRSDQTRRRWLAGMIANPPCAVLDVEALIPAGMRADTVA